MSGQIEYPSLNGKTVLVVGGGSGIGKAIAQLAHNKKATVSIASRNEEKLARAAKEIGTSVEYSTVDMLDEKSVKLWASILPAIDHLVVSASSACHGKFADLETAPVRQMFDSKFFGPYVIARELLPKINAGGSITFFSGVLSRRPGENCSGLGAVNGAIESLTYALALELGPDVRVNCCSPGMVRSDAYASIPEQDRENMYR